MMDVYNLWNYNIKFFNIFESNEIDLLKDIIFWISKNGFTMEGSQNKLKTEFKMNLSYNNYSVISLIIKKEKSIELKKVNPRESNSVSIQEAKKYFYKYWIYNIKKKEFNFDEIEELKNIFTDIKEVFFDDIEIDFKINSIRLQNFRCFEDNIFQFPNKSSLFIGNNASGKTALLDGITVAIGGFLSGINELKSADYKTIKKSDVRFTIREVENVVNSYNHVPVRVECESNFISKSISWARALNKIQGATTTGEANNLTNIIEQLVDDINNGSNDRRITLPIFSYHGTGRLGKFLNDMRLLDKTEKITRFVGYNNCLEAKSDYKFFVAWYRKMKYQAFESEKKIPVLDAVTRSIANALKMMLLSEGRNDIVALKYLEGEINLLYDDGMLAPVSTLSDGYRDLIGIVSDIAYRMAILNPHLGDSVVEKTPGVVLIDEIDLHLHPQWQMTILKMLTEVFPRVQFITTTHSPIVLSETKQDEAFELIRNNGYIEARKIGNPKSWYIVDVLSHAFHIYPDEIKNDEVDEYLDLEDQLKIFSDKVKEYVSKPDLVLKNEIEMIFEKLLPSFPEGSPKRKLINSLKELVV